MVLFVVSWQWCRNMEINAVKIDGQVQTTYIIVSFVWRG